MTSSLFAYPSQAEFNRVIPKSKIYAYAKASRSVRDRFVKEVDQIVWKYKLAPETINLSARPGVMEIQVFFIFLRGEELSEAVLRAIDKAVAFPIFFELYNGTSVRSVAAYKRPSDADSNKWVIEGYFETDWVKMDAARESLPVALDLGQLYTLLLQHHISLPARPGEVLKDHVARVNAIRMLESECQRMQAQLQQEKQFNRKVDINRGYRELTEELKRLQDPLDAIKGKRYG